MVSLALRASAFAVVMFWCALQVWRAAREHPDGWKLRSKLGIIFFWSTMVIFAGLLWYVVSPNVGDFLVSLILVAAIGWRRKAKEYGGSSEAGQ